VTRGQAVPDAPEPVRVGLIGCGAVAAAHVRDLYGRPDADARLVACADTDDAASDRFARAHDVPASCAVAALLARPDVDAVDICTSSSSHLALIAQAVEHGKHAICEKPLALELGGARAVADAADRAGVTVGVMQNYRWRPEYRDAQALVAAGHIGAPVLGTLQALFDWHGGPRHEGDPDRALLLELTYHYVDLLRFLLGSDVREIYGATRGSGGRTGAVLILRFDSGAVGNIVNSSGCRGVATNWGGSAVVQGSEGTAYVNLPRPFRLAAYAPVLGGRVERTYARDLYPLSTGSRFGPPLSAFFRALVAGEPAPVSVRDNLNTLAAVLAACESAETGRPVAVDAEG
jgi:predicted dehydrogenase